MATRRDALIEHQASDFLGSDVETQSTSGGTSYDGGELTRNDGPPWPHANASAQINAAGTNHRDVVLPKDVKWKPRRAWAWVEDPAREAPAGSELARKRARSRQRSPVPCQTTYAKRRFGGNSRLDQLMDAGVCWHYNADLAQRYARTAATIQRPDGRDGALAFYDGCGQLRFLDASGQYRPKYPGRLRTGTVMAEVSCDAEPTQWDPRGLGKPVDDYTQSEDLWGPQGERRTVQRNLEVSDADDNEADATEASDPQMTATSTGGDAKRDADANVTTDDSIELRDLPGPDSPRRSVPVSDTGATEVPWVEGIPNAVLLLGGAAVVAALLAVSGGGRS